MSSSHAGTCGCCAPSAPEEPRPAPSATKEGVCYCPIDGLIDTISGKYAMQIVSVVGSEGSARFRDLEGVFSSASTSTLSNRLEELVDVGVLERVRYDEMPPHVEYRLTPAGEELQARLEPLLEWVAEADDGASSSLEGASTS